MIMKCELYYVPIYNNKHVDFDQSFVDNLRPYKRDERMKSVKPTKQMNEI